MRYLGSFVSVAGGLKNGIINGNKLNVNTIMIHPTPPQRWNFKGFAEEPIVEFNEERKNSKIEKIFFHGIYLINLANPDKQKFHLSKMSLVHYLDLAEAINADGVVFHTGSFKDIGEEEGFERIVKGLTWIMNETKSTKNLMLEMAAGSGNVVGDKLEELKKIRDMLEDSVQKRVHFCLDSQHMFASGYDIVNKVDEVVDEVDKILGIENVKLVHLNDSKTDFASNKDRHENLGEGKIGEKGIKGFLNHPKMKNVPFVLETPAMKDLDTSGTEEIQKLLNWAV